MARARKAGLHGRRHPPCSRGYLKRSLKKVSPYTICISFACTGLKITLFTTNSLDFMHWLGVILEISFILELWATHVTRVLSSQMISFYMQLQIMFSLPRILTIRTSVPHTSMDSGNVDGKIVLVAWLKRAKVTRIFGPVMLCCNMPPKITSLNSFIVTSITQKPQFLMDDINVIFKIS